MSRQYSCPNCEKKEGVDIFYGEPTAELSKEAELGEILLGGCVVKENQPYYHCKACGFEWDKKAHFDNAKKIWLRDYVKGRSWEEMMSENDNREVPMDEAYLAMWKKAEKDYDEGAD
jgi:hypothetical protein